MTMTVDMTLERLLGRDRLILIGAPAVDALAIDFDGTIRTLDGDGDILPEVDIGAFETPAL